MNIPFLKDLELKELEEEKEKEVTKSLSFGKTEKGLMKSKEPQREEIEDSVVIEGIYFDEKHEEVKTNE